MIDLAKAALLFVAGACTVLYAGLSVLCIGVWIYDTFRRKP